MPPGMPPGMFYPPPMPYYMPYPMYPAPMPQMGAPPFGMGNSRGVGFFPPPLVPGYNSRMQGSQRATPERDFDFMAQHHPEQLWD
mmetsp:Transcript_43142/g.31520  ORF Transcript_43142/g.31520 Transcript_43142/m.31520 type:complete len:85 (+) Transcript_43142:11-265(+)